MHESGEVENFCHYVERGNGRAVYVENVFDLGYRQTLNVMRRVLTSYDEYAGKKFVSIEEYGSISHKRWRSTGNINYAHRFRDRHTNRAEDDFITLDGMWPAHSNWGRFTPLQT